MGMWYRCFREVMRDKKGREGVTGWRELEQARWLEEGK